MQLKREYGRTVASCQRSWIAISIPSCALAVCSCLRHRSVATWASDRLRRRRQLQILSATAGVQACWSKVAVPPGARCYLRNSFRARARAIVTELQSRRYNARPRPGRRSVQSRQRYSEHLQDRGRSPFEYGAQRARCERAACLQLCFPEKMRLPREPPESRVKIPSA